VRGRWTLFVALVKDWLRNREAVFFAVLFPILLLVIFSTVFASGAAEFTIYVQNNDLEDGEPTNTSAAFVAALNDTDAVTVRHIAADRNVTDWSRNVETDGSKRVVVLPDGFAEQVQSGASRARVQVIDDTLARAGGQINESQRAAIRQGTGQLRANDTNATATVRFLAASDDASAPAVRGIVESVVAGFNDRAVGVDEPPATVTSGDLGTRNLDAVDYYLPAFIAAVVMINGLITMTTVVAGFNADGVLKRLVATPLRRRDWILANVVHQSVLALVLTGVMVAVAHLLFGASAVPGPLSLLLVLVGAVAFSGAGMALGSFVSDPDAATSLGNAIAFPMMFLSGVFWQLELMPDFLQTVALALPLYHFHQGLRQLMVLGTTDGVVVPFAVLGATAIVTLGLAVRLTEWQDLDG
jgi:ABC-2 type transport system permease protein